MDAAAGRPCLDYRYKTALAENRRPGHPHQTDGDGRPCRHAHHPQALPAPALDLGDVRADRQQPGRGGEWRLLPPALPANANQKPSPGFTFFNPACDPKKDPTYKCMHNAPPACRAGRSGTVCDPYDKPMQITRLNPVGAPANKVTTYVWGLLPAESVFNYYRLVDVQWPQAAISKNLPGPGMRVPLTMGNPTPVGSAGGTEPDRREHDARILPAKLEQLHGLPRELRLDRLAAGDPGRRGSRRSAPAEQDPGRRPAAICVGLQFHLLQRDEAVGVARGLAEGGDSRVRVPAFVPTRHSSEGGNPASS